MHTSDWEPQSADLVDLNEVHDRLQVLAVAVKLLSRIMQTNVHYDCVLVE